MVVIEKPLTLVFWSCLCHIPASHADSFRNKGHVLHQIGAGLGRSQLTHTQSTPTDT